MSDMLFESCPSDSLQTDVNIIDKLIKVIGFRVGSIIIIKEASARSCFGICVN